MEDDLPIPKKFHNKIIKAIQYCDGCQPRDNEEDDGMIWIFGDRIGFWDFLKEIELPNKYFDKIDDYYECPNCGSPISLGSDIGLENEYEAEIEKRFRVIQRKVVPNINEFEIFIEKYPYLGSMHLIGKRIEKEIESLGLISIENEIWYRARNICESRVFKKKDMEPPNADIVPISEGRFNHYGQSHLYVGDSKDVCIEEINRNIEAICWMQKIKITEIDRILDLSTYISSDNIDDIPATFCGVMYNRTINKEVKKGKNWKPEYFISRYIADIAKKHGIKGIKYSSSVALGKNLVLFNMDRTKIEFIDEPEIFIHKREEELF